MWLLSGLDGSTYPKSLQRGGRSRLIESAAMPPRLDTASRGRTGTNSTRVGFGACAIDADLATIEERS